MNWPVLRATGQAERGHGQVVGIVGEPGVGNPASSLISAGVDGTSVMVLEGARLSYRETYPYLPVLDFLKSYFHIEETSLRSEYPR